MTPAGTLALTTADRQALIPMAAGYLILMSALGFGLRRLYRPRGAQSGADPAPGQGEQPARPRPRRRSGPRPRRQAGPRPRRPARPRTGRAALPGRSAGTVIGGYLLLMAVIVAYYFGVARVGPGFLESALTGTALLLGLATPVFAALSWLSERRGRS